MSKLMSVIIGMVLGAMITGVASEGRALSFYESEGLSYYASTGGGTCFNQYYYLLVVSYESYTGDGILFINPSTGAYKIMVFDNQDLRGWSIEGYWIGDGSAGYGVLNNGATFQTAIFVIPDSLSHSENPRSETPGYYSLQ